jgi:hypothetical protein
VFITFNSAFRNVETSRTTEFRATLSLFSLQHLNYLTCKNPVVTICVTCCYIKKALHFTTHYMYVFHTRPTILHTDYFPKQHKKSVFKMDLDLVLCEVETKYSCVIYIYIYIYRGPAMDEMLLGWRVTAKSRVQSKAGP